MASVHRISRVACVCSPLLLIAACVGTHSDALVSKKDWLTPDSDASSDVDASFEALPEDIEKIVATAKGGTPPPTNDASTCQPVDDTFTLIPKARTLSWRACVWTEADGGEAAGAYRSSEGEMTLSESDYKFLVAPLRALRPSSEDHCTEGKPVQAIVMTSPRGVVSYLDEYDACSKKGSYVRGMEDAFRTLRRGAGVHHGGPHPRLSVDGFDRTCSSDSDCEGVSEGDACWSCCENAAVSKSAADAYNAKREQLVAGCDPGVNETCTLGDCPPVAIACVNGMCKVTVNY